MIQRLFVGGLGSLIVLFFLALPSHGADDPFFSKQFLTVDGQVLWVTPACLASTKQKELLIATRLGTYPDYTVELTVTRETKILRRYTFKDPKNQPLGFDLIGDCQQDKQELVFLFPERVDVVSWEGDPSGNQQLIQREPVPTSSLVAELGSLPQLDLMRDFNQDQKLDLLWPVADQQLLFLADLLSSAPQRQKFNYPLKTYLRTAPTNQPLSMAYSLRQSRWLPEIVSADHNGDGRVDMIFVWLDELSIFWQRPDGTFPPERSAHVTLGLLTEEDRSQPTSNAQLLLAQLGDDSFVDYLANRSRGSIADLKTLSRLTLRNSQGETQWELPASQGNASNALLLDVNHDGHLDIVTAAVQTGTMATIQALLNSTVDVRFHFFIANDQGAFGKRADFRRELGFKFNLKSFTPQGFLPSLQGDFNGDGRRDAMYGRDGNHLHILLQSAKGELFPAGISYKGDVAVSELYALDDFNGDGLSDVAFWYRDWARRNQVLVLTNQGKLRAAKLMSSPAAIP